MRQIGATSDTEQKQRCLSALLVWLRGEIDIACRQDLPEVRAAYEAAA